MRTPLTTVFLLLMSTASLADTKLPLCVASPDNTPKSWLPQDSKQKALSSTEPWTDEEAKDARYSLKTGLDEMIAHFSKKPSAVPAMWEDAVGALIEVTYSSANKPEIDEAAREAAERNLTALIQPYLKRDPEKADCDDFEDLIPLAIYAHKFYPENDPRTAKITVLTNAGFDDCGSLADAIDFDFREGFKNKKLPIDTVFDQVIWSLLFIEAELYPAIELPPESREFSPALWRYLDGYRLKNATEYEDGAWDEEFIEVAYLATHIAYIPTGNHRFPIYIQDSPALYRYHRENFYPTLAMGELDLVAEFVDSLRQYGCTPENDVQVRDGTRYMLKVFHDGKDSWMAYREPDQTDEDVDDYDLIHKAWTAVLGVRERNIEPAEQGTYGGVVRRWLPAPN